MMSGTPYRDALARIGGRARLVAVTKGRPVEAVRALYDLGQRDFGENRVDELVEKRAALPDDARWHFIGNLQRNKLKRLGEARPALVHSFDRPDLLAHWPPGVPVLLQVHLGGGEHRNGLAPTALEAALEACERAGVRCEGLALLPPKGEAPRPYFARLRELRDGLAPRWPGVRELSMGMSEDYLDALDEGATMVRIGRALFEPLAP